MSEEQVSTEVQEEVKEEKRAYGSIYARIAAASRAVPALQPDKTHSQNNYAYISADAVLENVGRAMAEHGLVIIMEVVGEHIEVNGKRYDTLVEFDVTVGDEEGHELHRRWIGRGTDYTTPDKALYKALTTGHKYFLMKLFNVGVGNPDGEHDPVPTPGTSPAVNQRQRQQPANGNGSANGSSAGEEVADIDVLQEINELGRSHYGEEWKERREKISKWVTDGRTISLSLLTSSEAQKTLKGLKDKIAEENEQARGSVKDAQPPTASDDDAEPDEDGVRVPEAVRAEIVAVASAEDADDGDASDGQKRFVRAALGDMVGDYETGKPILEYLFGIKSSNELTKSQASAVIDWSGSTSANNFTPLEQSVEEAKMILDLLEEAAPA